MNITFKLPPVVSQDTRQMSLTFDTETTVEEGVAIYLKAIGRDSDIRDARMYRINGKVAPPRTILKDKDEVTFRPMFIGG